MAETQGGEVPFSVEERYRMRVILHAFEGITKEDMVDVKQFAQTGRATRLAIAIIGRIAAILSGVFGAILAYKSLWGKGI